MTSGRRRTTAGALVLLGALSASACSPPDGDGGPTDDRTRQNLATLWTRDPREPYPFSGAVPPLDETPLDGLYVRTVPVADVGRPVPCRRCPPYRIYAGDARLTLERGRYYIDEDGSQFGSEGHFVVADGAITLFNDPICPRERVTYRYSFDDGKLAFEARRDPCAFQNLRGKYLSGYRWTGVGGRRD